MTELVQALKTADDALAHAIEVATRECASASVRFELDHAHRNVVEALTRLLTERTEGSQ
jgi:phosphate uptake regulator